MTRIVRLERPDRLLKDIVYLLIIKGKVQRIRSSAEDFYVFKFFIFYKNTFESLRTDYLEFPRDHGDGAP